MNVNKLDALQDAFKSCKPPMDLVLLETFINLDWCADSEDEEGVLCDIMIRLGVDAIICASILQGPRRDSYHSAFLRLADKIETSKLLASSSEFQSYFASYKSYVADFSDPNTQLDCGS